MRAFFDTSVLVATFYREHEHHEASFAVFVAQSSRTGCTAAHCLAETYGVLTGMPGKHRTSPDEALLFLNDVRQRLTTISMSGDEYFALLEDAAVAGITGGGVHDAVIAACATKAGVDCLYTWNLKHFARLGTSVAGRVRTPEIA